MNEGSGQDSAGHQHNSDQPMLGIQKKGVKLLLKRPPEWNTTRGAIDMYYWFWGTRALSRIGGEAWVSWRKAMKPILMKSQRKDATTSGSRRVE